LRLDLPRTKYVIGDGPQLAEFRQQYPSVRFIGARLGMLATYLAAADVFVFPSRTDTFGLVMLEAMACGVPVAAFPVQGPLDVVRQARSAFWTMTWAGGATSARAGRRRCREFAVRFSWQETTKQFLGHLILSRMAPHRSPAEELASEPRPGGTHGVSLLATAATPGHTASSLGPM
jgi:glycosyltransferase involved in cell wall biosynthesis